MSDEALNQRLQQLVQEAQQHPPLTPQRQIALNKLIDVIWRSKQLGHPQSGQWPSNLYEDLYNEALQKPGSKSVKKSSSTIETIP